MSILTHLLAFAMGALVVMGWGVVLELCARRRKAQAARHAAFEAELTGNPEGGWQ